MLAAKKNFGFTLVELLVVIAIIGILAGLLLPVLGTVTDSAKATATASMLGNLRTAIDMYFKDEGTYPPDATAQHDKCSEALYFYLIGQEVSSPNASRRQSLRAQRAGQTVYMDFHVNSLGDFDSDNYYEIIDEFGNPWIYVRGPYPGKAKVSSTGNPAENYRPWHRRNSYDLFSVSKDGKTGTRWNTHSRMFEWGPNNSGSIYKQATDEYEDGLKSEGGYSADDIANF